jgi:hypothetical protein
MIKYKYARFPLYLKSTDKILSEYLITWKKGVQQPQFEHFEILTIEYNYARFPSLYFKLIKVTLWRGLRFEHHRCNASILGKSGKDKSIFLVFFWLVILRINTQQSISCKYKMWGGKGEELISYCCDFSISEVHSIVPTHLCMHEPFCFSKLRSCSAHGIMEIVESTIRKNTYIIMYMLKHLVDPIIPV